VKRPAPDGCERLPSGHRRAAGKGDRGQSVGGSRGSDGITEKPLNRLARLNRTAATKEFYRGALVVLWR